MRAKCRICGRQLDTNTAYKIVDKNGKNKYFCSQTEYEAEEARKKKAKEDRDKVYYLICDIMGEKEIINTILWKEWAIWNKVSDNEKIAKYLIENKNYLTSAVSRLSGTEYAKIRYVSAYLKNGLNDFEPKAEVEKPVRPQEPVEISDTTVNFYINKKEKTKRRKGFSEEE